MSASSIQPILEILGPFPLLFNPYSSFPHPVAGTPPHKADNSSKGAFLKVQLFFFDSIFFSSRHLEKPLMTMNNHPVDSSARPSIPLVDILFPQHICYVLFLYLVSFAPEVYSFLLFGSNMFLLGGLESISLWPIRGRVPVFSFNPCCRWFSSDFCRV